MVWRVIHHLFARPWGLWLLVLLPVLGVIALVALRRRRWALARWGTRPAIEAMTSVRPWRRFFRLMGRGLGLALLILGIAGPRWGHEPDPAAAPGRDLVVLLDMSRSMLAQDVLGKSALNRLGRAKD